MPIDRVIKNQDITDNKLSFEDMNLNELEHYYNRFKKLKNNSHLLKSLKDNGDKLIQKYQTIEVIF